jgi:hypothetical protein
MVAPVASTASLAYPFRLQISPPHSIGQWHRRLACGSALLQQR